eukprot:g8941.t1
MGTGVAAFRRLRPRHLPSRRRNPRSIEDVLSGGPSFLGTTDGNFLLKQLEQLQKEEEQLRDEKLLLLKERAAAAVTPSASKNGSDFAAA